MCVRCYCCHLDVYMGILVGVIGGEDVSVWVLVWVWVRVGVGVVWGCFSESRRACYYLVWIWVLDKIAWPRTWAWSSNFLFVWIFICRRLLKIEIILNFIIILYIILSLLLLLPILFLFLIWYFSNILYISISRIS